MYSIVVNKGVNCWMIHLTNTKPSRWVALGSRTTMAEALELAEEIRAGIRSSEVLVGV